MKSGIEFKRMKRSSNGSLPITHAVIHAYLLILSGSQYIGVTTDIKVIDHLDRLVNELLQIHLSFLQLFRAMLELEDVIMRI